MNNMQKVDLIIKNGTILTMNNQMEVIENGVVIIEGNKITAIGNNALANEYQAEKVIDADGGIIMPGMVNCHNHLPMIAFRGLGEEGIGDRLMRYFLPLEKELLTRDLIYKATLHGAIDLAFSGVTTYADMYYHVDEMARATTTVGLRAIVGQTVVGFPVVDAAVEYDGLNYAQNIIEGFADNELVSMAIYGKR